MQSYLFTGTPVVALVYNQTKLDLKIESIPQSAKFLQEAVTPLPAGYPTAAVAVNVSVL